MKPEFESNNVFYTIPVEQSESRLNRWFDMLSSPGVTFAGMPAPPYLVFGVTGITCAICVLTFLALRAEISLVVVALASVVSIFVFLLGGLLRQLVARGPHILIEDLLLVLGSTALLAWVFGVETLLLLDRLIISLGVFLVFGRLGCLTSGCCHGKPASIGVKYDNRTFPAALIGIRLFPIQLVEAIWIAVITGSAYQLLGRSGDSLSFWLIAYSAGRFVFEFARGDVKRKIFGPLSEAQWWCVFIIGGVLAVYFVLASMLTVERVSLLIVVTTIIFASMSHRYWLAIEVSGIPEKEIPAWYSFVSELRTSASSGRKPIRRASPQQGIEIELEVDASDAGSTLHSYRIFSQQWSEAIFVAGFLLQSLPEHRVVRINWEQEAVVLWVWVAEHESVAEYDREILHPRHVILRASAFANYLCINGFQTRGNTDSEVVQATQAERGAEYFRPHSQLGMNRAVTTVRSKQ